MTGQQSHQLIGMNQITKREQLINKESMSCLESRKTKNEVDLHNGIRNAENHQKLVDDPQIDGGHQIATERKVDRLLIRQRDENLQIVALHVTKVNCPRI